MAHENVKLVAWGDSGCKASPHAYLFGMTTEQIHIVYILKGVTEMRILTKKQMIGIMALSMLFISAQPASAATCYHPDGWEQASENHIEYLYCPICLEKKAGSERFVELADHDVEMLEHIWKEKECYLIYRCYSCDEDIQDPSPCKVKKTVVKKATEKKLGLIKYEAMETTAMEDEDDDTRYFHLLAKPSKITVTNKATRKIVVKWSRNTTAGGYQVQFSVNKNFSKPRTTVKSTGNKTTTITFKNATKGKTYYVRVRSWKKIKGEGTIFSQWSAVKSVKIKK